MFTIISSQENSHIQSIFTWKTLFPNYDAGYPVDSIKKNSNCNKFFLTLITSSKLIFYHRLISIYNYHFLALSSSKNINIIITTLENFWL